MDYEESVMVEVAEETIGWKVEVFWEEEEEWFRGTIVDYDEVRGYFVHYEDDEKQWELLDREEGCKFRFIKKVGPIDEMEPEETKEQESVEGGGKSEQEHVKSNNAYFDHLDEQAESEMMSSNVETKDVDLSPSKDRTSETFGYFDNLDAVDVKSDTKEEYSYKEPLPCVDQVSSRNTQKKTENTNIHTKELFFKDRESLLDLKRELEKKKGDLQSEKDILRARFQAAEIQKKSLKQQLDEVKAEITLNDLSYVRPPKPKPRTKEDVNERILELKLMNRQLREEHEKIRNQSDEIKKSLEQKQDILQEKSKKLENFPPHVRKTLSELQVEINFLLEEKKKLQGRKNRNRLDSTHSSQIDDQTIRCLRQQIEDFRDQLEDNRKSKRKAEIAYEQELAQITPLQEQCAILSRRLDEYGSSFSLLKKVFDRFDASQQGKLSLEQAKKALVEVHPQKGDETFRDKSTNDINNYLLSALEKKSDQISFKQFTKAFLNITFNR